MIHDSHVAQRLTSAPHGFDSLLAKGRSRPDPSDDVEIVLNGPDGAYPATLATGKPTRRLNKAADGDDQGGGEGGGVGAGGAGGRPQRAKKGDVDANIEGSSFYQDEIIVFSEAQARLRYVVRLAL